MPLAVWVGLNDPQVPTGAQLQSTPAFDASCETTAVSGFVAFTCIDDGGAGLKTIEIGGGTGVIVIVAEADFVESACEVAVTLTVPPEGTAAGAVY
jgi:hypothetical protein